jgi:hypothetical protein
MKKLIVIIFLLGVLAVTALIPVQVEADSLQMGGKEVGDVMNPGMTGCKCPLRNPDCGCAIVFEQ